MPRLYNVVMRIAVAMFFVASAAAGQTTSTLCLANEVTVGTSTVDLRLIGCGESYSDNLLWHLDRGDSLTGALDTKVTRTLTGKGAVVYVVDTGVMRTHDEFVRDTGSAVIGGINISPGGDCKPRDVTIDPCWTTDIDLSINTHGTAVASIVNGRNTGVAPDAKVVAVYAPAAGQNIALWLQMLDAIIAHAFNPATPQFRTAVVNMSFTPGLVTGNNKNFPLFEQKMRQMIGGIDAAGNPDPNGKRFLFVTVAGNRVDGPGTECDPAGNTIVFPATLGASIDGLITVGGIDKANHLWDRSCRGPALDVLAPAVDMLVASISGQDHYRSGKAQPYPWNSGTSYAAPFVSGVAAQLLERDPNATPAELEAQIKTMATGIDGGDDSTTRMVASFAPAPAQHQGPRRRAARP